MQNMASVIDVFINPSTHIEVIDEASVKMMQLEYGNPAVHGLRETSCERKPERLPPSYGAALQMDDVCLLN